MLFNELNLRHSFISLGCSFVPGVFLPFVCNISDRILHCNAFKGMKATIGDWPVYFIYKYYGPHIDLFQYMNIAFHQHYYCAHLHSNELCGNIRDAAERVPILCRISSHRCVFMLHPPPVSSNPDAIPGGWEGNGGKKKRRMGGGGCLCSHIQPSPGICRCVSRKQCVGVKRGSDEYVRRHLGSFWFHLGPEDPRLKHVSRLFPDRTKPLSQTYWMVDPAVKWGPDSTRRLCSTFPGSVQDTTVQTREKQQTYSRQHHW